MLVPTLLKAALTSDKASMDVFGTDEMSVRAWPWLCDVNGHVNNARYMDLASTGRMRWLVRVGALRGAIAQRFSFIIAGVAAVYRRPIPRMATFALATRVAAYDRRWVCYEQTFLLRHAAGDQVAARFLTRGQLRDRSGALEPLEGLHRLGLRVPAGAPPAPPDLEIWSATLEANLDAIRQRDRAAQP